MAMRLEAQRTIDLESSPLSDSEDSPPAAEEPPPIDEIEQEDTASIHLTDVGNGRRLVRQFGQDLH